MMASLQAPRLLPSRSARALLFAPIIPAVSTTRASPVWLDVRHSSSSSPSSIVQLSFWKSLIPKFLRGSPGDEGSPEAGVRRKSKGWNPATFYICIFMLIGSMSIQMIRLRTTFDNYMRSSEVKVGLLREVVERLQRGEKVDVEQALGTGDPEKEKGWEDLLRDIEQEGTKPPRRQPSRSERKQQDKSQPATPEQSGTSAKPSQAASDSTGFY